MTDFKPTDNQQALIEAAQRLFEESRESKKRYSKRFVDKCTDQSASSAADRPDEGSQQPRSSQDK